MYTGISFTFVVYVLSKLIIIISTTEEQEICVVTIRICMDPAQEPMLVVTWCILGDFAALF